MPGFGKVLEVQLELRHRQYREAGLATVVHCHPGVKFLGDGDVVPNSKGPPDFMGTLSSARSVVFDAKETRRKTWPFGSLEDHQARDLGSFDTMGALSFLFIRYVKQREDYVLPWADIREDWWAWRERTEGRSRPASIRNDDPRLVRVSDRDWLTALEDR